MSRSSPYRATRHPAPRPKHATDRDLVPVFGLLWVMSVAVVIRSVFRYDVFGAEATMALTLVVALPVLMAGAKGRA